MLKDGQFLRVRELDWGLEFTLQQFLKADPKRVHNGRRVYAAQRTVGMDELVKSYSPKFTIFMVILHLQQRVEIAIWEDNNDGR